MNRKFNEPNAYFTLRMSVTSYARLGRISNLTGLCKADVIRHLIDSCHESYPPPSPEEQAEMARLAANQTRTGHELQALVPEGMKAFQRRPVANLGYLPSAKDPFEDTPDWPEDVPDPGTCPPPGHALRAAWLKKHRDD